jgi:hypothetical protein
MLYTLFANRMGSAADFPFKMLYIIFIAFADSCTLDFFIRTPLPKPNRIAGIESRMSEYPFG